VTEAFFLVEELDSSGLAIDFLFISNNSNNEGRKKQKAINGKKK